MKWDVEILHRQVLYPVVRVRAKKAVGSGTILFSGQNKSGEYETYVLTNHHVVESAIEVRKQWDSMLGREIKKEFKSLVQVELFRYKYLSRSIGETVIDAEIVAYDEAQDLALLKLRSIDKMDFVAYTYPPQDMKNIHVFDKVVAVGAAMGAPPIPTVGHICNLDIEIDNYLYGLSTALTIYGNSGGALFRWSDNRQRWEFIGVPSRIQVMLGFSTQAITHMGYFIPVWRVYNFLDDWCYQFIYDPNYTIEQCNEMRERKKEEAKQELARIYGAVEESETVE